MHPRRHQGHIIPRIGLTPHTPRAVNRPHANNARPRRRIVLLRTPIVPNGRDNHNIMIERILNRPMNIGIVTVKG